MTSTAGNMGFGNSRAGRCQLRLQLAISFSSGLTLSIWLLVVIFNFSFSIGFGHRLDVIKSPAIAKPCSLHARQRMNFWFSKNCGMTAFVSKKFRCQNVPLFRGKYLNQFTIFRFAFGWTEESFLILFTYVFSAGNFILILKICPPRFCGC